MRSSYSMSQRKCLSARRSACYAKVVIYKKGISQRRVDDPFSYTTFYFKPNTLCIAFNPEYGSSILVRHTSSGHINNVHTMFAGHKHTFQYPIIITQVFLMSFYSWSIESLHEAHRNQKLLVYYISWSNIFPYSPLPDSMLQLSIFQINCHSNRPIMKILI